MVVASLKLSDDRAGNGTVTVTVAEVIMVEDLT